MLSLRQRLPSLQSIYEVFYACVVVVQAWELVNLVYNIPALRLRETTWDLLGIIAIVQAFALFESLLACLALTGLSVLAPSALRRHFPAQATGALLVSAAWAIGVHLSGASMTTWAASRLWSWIALYLAGLGLAAWAIWRFPRLEGAIRRLLANLGVLAWVYIALGLVSLAIILIRNLPG